MSLASTFVLGSFLFAQDDLGETVDVLVVGKPPTLRIVETC